MTLAVGERVFLRNDRAEQPRGLQREDENEKFKFHRALLSVGDNLICFISLRRFFSR